MEKTDVPGGFADLVKAVIKEPAHVAIGSEIWNRFVRVVLMGGPRYDTEITFLVNILKSTKLLDLHYVNSINGEKWREEIEAFLKERLSRISDEESSEIINSVLGDLFRISASLKGSARFFRDRKLIEHIDIFTKTKESTGTLIEEIVNSEDVSGVKYTKVIMWLHSIGRGQDFAPPSRHVKDFVNKDIGPYCQFYDDDKYFMGKMNEVTVQLNIRNATVMDVARAAFYYRTLKSMLPQRSKQSKSFTPSMLMKFMKSSKLSFAALNEALEDSEKKHRLIEKINNFMDKHA